jgi:hypothetical protein
MNKVFINLEARGKKNNNNNGLATAPITASSFCAQDKPNVPV